MSTTSLTDSSAGSTSGTEPLVVKPKLAWVMLCCGNTRGYELLAAGELDSYLDGRSRKITVDSIHEYIARRLAALPPVLEKHDLGIEAGSTAHVTPPARRRGRPPHRPPICK
jgi:hypothetical protein